MAERVSLDALDEKLADCTRTLGDCTALVRDLNFKPQENIYRIADAIAIITRIQQDIYRIRPDLTREWARPQDEPREPR
jgi:hypothetical protein